MSYRVRTFVKNELAIEIVKGILIHNFRREIMDVWSDAHLDNILYRRLLCFDCGCLAANEEYWNRPT